MRILLRLLGYLRRHLKAVALAYVSLAGALIFTALMPWMLKRAIDAGIAGHSERALVISGLAIVGFSIGKGVSAYLQSYLGEYLSQSVAYDLRRDFYLKVQSLSFAFHDQVDTGQLMSRATVDVEVSRQFLSLGLLRSVYTFGLAIVIAGVMLTMNWHLAILVFLAIPAVTTLSVLVTKRTRPLWSQVQQQVGVEASVLQESIAGMRTVKAYGQEGQQRERFRAANWAVRELSLRANQIAAFNQPFLLYILNLIALAILWYGGHLVLGGTLTIGTLVAFSEYQAQLAAPIRTFGFLLNLATRASSAGERLFEIIDRPSEVRDAPGAKPLDAARGHVRYEHVSFGYSHLERPVVADIAIDARPGETIALLGATGSGKTTILHLLPRFYDATSGRITIDGADIRDVTLESLRRNVGVVLQDVFLFNATIRENIAYGKPGATQEEIEGAARVAQIHDYIAALPDGYDTWVGERGLTLSGGQRQRVAIARTLLMDPRILVLDDSTSAVDMETEFLIQRALAELIKGRTSFVIAHRLRTIKQADQILVLDEGRIVQRGRHAELVAQPGLYRDIYRLQLRDQETADEPAKPVEPVEVVAEVAS
jgi:ATP-binding cassette subfamily B protein